MHEHEAYEFLAEIGLPYLRTGSREICSPAPTDTDVDFVVLDDALGFDPTQHGFIHTNYDETGEYDGCDFNTYRNGEVNLIVVNDWGFFKKWRIATKQAKAANILDKGERIKLFRGILYNEWN